MKFNFKVFVFIAAVGTVALFASFAFSYWSINPATWGVLQRSNAAFFWFFGLIISAVIAWAFENIKQ